MARARSASGRASRRLPQVPQDEGEVVQADGDVGVVGAVGGLGDGQGPFGQRPGLGQPGMDLQVGGGAIQQPGSSAPAASCAGPGRRRSGWSRPARAAAAPPTGASPAARP